MLDGESYPEYTEFLQDTKEDYTMCDEMLNRDEEGNLITGEQDAWMSFEEAVKSVESEPQDLGECMAGIRARQVLQFLDEGRLSLDSPEAMTPELEKLLTERMLTYSKLLGLDKEPVPVAPELPHWVIWTPGTAGVASQIAPTADEAVAKSLFPAFNFEAKPFSSLEARERIFLSPKGSRDVKEAIVTISITAY